MNRRNICNSMIRLSKYTNALISETFSEAYIYANCLSRIVSLLNVVQSNDCKKINAFVLLAIIAKYGFPIREWVERDEKAQWIVLMIGQPSLLVMIINLTPTRESSFETNGLIQRK